MASDAADKRMKRIRKELDAAEKTYKKWAEEFKTDRLEGFVVRSRQTKDPKTDQQLNADSYQVNLLAPSLASRIPALMFDRPHALVTPKDPMADDAALQAPLPPAPPGMGLPPQGMPGMPPGGDLGGLAALLGGGAVPSMAPPPMPKPLTAQDKAKLREDLLNSIIQDQESRFSCETKLGIREAFFRFGCVEVLYTAEFEERKGPEKVSLKPGEPGPPAAKSDEEQVDGTDTKEDALEGEPQDEDDTVTVPSRLVKPGTERIKFRRIPANQVRISSNQKNDLERCDWVAYYDWMYLSDIQKNRNFSNRYKVKATHSNSSGDESGQIQKDSKEGEDSAPVDGMVKVWKLWDIRQKKRFCWADGEDFFLVDGKEFNLLPLAILKFEELLDQFYPVPPAFYWTGTQIEYNETRDAQRTHRRRALRKFVYNDGAFPDDEELAKLSSLEDMAFAKIVGNLPATAAIAPVQAAPMDPISTQQVMMVRSELQEVTKVGGEQRGVASSDTATQANIISMNKQIQDTTDRNTVADWLQKLCWIALRLAEANFTTRTVINTSVDLSGQGAQQEGQRVAETWKAIEMDQLGDLDYQVDIDIESLAPPSSTIKAQQANQMMATISNPNVMAILAQPQFEDFNRLWLSIQGFKDAKLQTGFIEGSKAIIGQAQAAQAAMAAPPPGAGPGAPTPAGPDMGGMGATAGLQEQIGAL